MLQSLKKRSLYERIIEQVKAYITENNLKPGDRLPTENELAQQLRVSRSSVHEAMKALETMGIIRAHARVGHVVQDLDMGILAEHLGFRFQVDQANLQQLRETREMLETAILPLAVQRATEKHFKKMEKSLELLKQEIDAGRPGVEKDMMFHEALFEAAGNKVLQGFADIVRRFFTELLQRRLATREGDLAALAEHTAIYHAVRAGDVDRAREELRKHLGSYLAKQTILDSSKNT